MNVIKQTGEPHLTMEEAQDSLAAAFGVPGIYFGYVDAELRVVFFALDIDPESELSPGQERVSLAFRESKASQVNLAPIAEAIMGKGPFA